jgi:hypothetical protein
MPIFDVPAMSGALKTIYGPELVWQIADKVTARKYFMKKPEDWLGNFKEYPIGLGRAQSFMAHGSLGVFPQAQNEVLVPVRIVVKWLHGRIQLETATMKQSAATRGGFARSMDLLMGRLKTNIADESNRMLSAGTGLGIFALVDDTASVGSAADPLELDAPGGIASNGYGARYLQPGMVIGFANPTGPALRSVRTISSISQDTDTVASIVLNAPVVAGTDYADNDYIVRIANASVTDLTRDSSYANEPMGLEGIIDDGTLTATFQNQSRSTYPDWQATRISVSAFSLDAMQRLTDTIDQQSGEMPTVFFCHHSMRRAYFAAVDTARTFMQTGKGPGKFDLGQEPASMELTYNDIPFKVDRDIQLGEILAANENYLDHDILVEGEWMDEDGAVLSRMPGQDAFEAVWRVAETYSTSKSNAHGKLVGMSITNAIGRHVA